MLVFSRRPGQKFHIGDDIVITVISVRGDDIRLGIEAPKDVKVNRTEVLEAIEKANQEAAASQIDEQDAARTLAAASRAMRVGV